jgi:two-component system sensor histidine kinase UhpB
VDFDEPDEVGVLSSEGGLHLYKAAHEGLSNALRHSQATRILVRLCAKPDGVTLVIEDNGCGIPGWSAGGPGSVTARPTAMGLRGMQQRMQSLGGDCLIESGAFGTRLSLMLPRLEPLLSR